MSSCVYFIQESFDGPVKIGVAFDPFRRLASLQVGNPRPLQLIAAFDGDRDLEREIHRRLAGSRVTGEWFHPTDDLFAVMREFAPPDEPQEPEPLVLTDDERDLYRAIAVRQHGSEAAADAFDERFRALVDGAVTPPFSRSDGAAA